MNYEALDEALAYIEYKNSDEVVNEGFITAIVHKVANRNKVGYIVSVKPENVGSRIDVCFPPSSLKYAAYSALINYCDAAQSTDNTFSVRESNKSKLETKIYVYKVSRFVDDKNPNSNRKSVKIMSLAFEGTISEIASKTDVKVEIGKDPDKKFINERKAIYKKALAIAKEIFDEAKKFPEYVGGFSIATVSKDDADGFFEGDPYYNYISLIDYNIRAAKSDLGARDLVHDKNFVKVFNFIYNELKSRISKAIPEATAEYYGDWDDGPFVLVMK